MGCCTSRQTDDSPDTLPYSSSASQAHHGDSSSRAITSSAIPPSTQPHLHPALNQSGSNISTPRRSHQSSTHATHPLPLAEHYNLPVRVHVWQSGRSWTSPQLRRERTEFFDTRVTGRPEVWSALSTATGLLREGDIKTAQGIIDAAGVTVPTGDICDGCYDEAGNLYRMPDHIVADPENIKPDSGDDGIRATGDMGQTMLGEAKTVDDSDEEEEEEEEEAIERRREEKGKGAERDATKIKCRLSDRGGPDLVVMLGKSHTVGALARKVHHEAGLARTSRIRIAYLGRLLHEKETLYDQGWKEGNVVNALVASATSAT